VLRYNQIYTQSSGEIDENKPLSSPPEK